MLKNVVGFLPIQSVSRNKLIQHHMLQANWRYLLRGSIV